MIGTSARRAEMVNLAARNRYSDWQANQP